MNSVLLLECWTYVEGYKQEMGYDTMFCMARTEEGRGEVLIDDDVDTDTADNDEDDVEEDVEEDFEEDFEEDEEDDDEDNDEDDNNNDDGGDSAFLLLFAATSCSCFIIKRS
tara:strand:+ start:145 stop:480 length:336 start_codon:yes stop_codon:yes gene_type:complete